MPRLGGILAVITAGPPTRTVNSLTCPATWASARAAGLNHTQHIVLVHAAIRDSQLDPHSAAVALGVPGWRIHTDLLIFVQPGGPL